MTVFVSISDDIVNLTSYLDSFQKARSARINLEKCTTLLMGDWREMEPPQLCRWIQDGFKILAIYFGTEKHMEKDFLSR